MSYAAIAKHNIPDEPMPQPDQSLLDGHFDGETKAEADIDHKINVLPAGTDPNHPDIHRAPPVHPEPIQLHPAPVPEPHVSEVAPTPLPTHPKGAVELPTSGEIEADLQKGEKKVKKEAKEVEKDAKEGLQKAEKEVKKGVAKAEEVGKEGLAKAEEVGKEGLAKASEIEKKAEKKGKEYLKKGEAELQKAENALAPYWERTKDVVLRPGTLGGLMGVVNVGLLSTLGYFAYTRKDQPWDRRIVSGAVVGTLALFGAEGYVAESYLSTPEGRAEAERAKKEGSKFWLQTKETVLRPGVAGGLVGAVNLAILSTVGYFSYQNWNRPWDPRVVSAVSVGLIGLSGLEGWAGKAYKDNELPKH